MQSQQTPTVAGSGAQLSNPMLVIAIMGVSAFVGVIAVAIGWFLIPKMGGNEPVNPQTPVPNPAMSPAGAPAGPSSASAPPVAPGAYGPYGGYSAPGGTPPPAAAAGTAAPAARRGAGVPTRANSFDMNAELKEVASTVPKGDHTVGPPPDQVTPAPPGLWQEIKASSPPKLAGPVTLGEDSGAGPPIPSMRVTAVQRGAQVAAIVQIGTEYFQVTPGKRIPESNPVYYVERIENDRVVLVRRWEVNGVKGVQRIEVTLQGAAPVPGGNGPGVPAGNGPGFPRLPGAG